MPRFRKGSKEAKAWGRRMKALRAHSEKRKVAPKRKLSHRIRHHFRRARRVLRHPVKAIRHYRRRRYQHREIHKTHIDWPSIGGAIVLGGSILGSLKLNLPNMSGNTTSPGNGGVVVTQSPEGPVVTTNPTSGTPYVTFTTIAVGASLTVNYTVIGATSPVTVSVNWGDNTSDATASSSTSGLLTHVYSNTSGQNFQVSVGAIQTNGIYIDVMSEPVFISGASPTSGQLAGTNPTPIPVSTNPPDGSGANPYNYALGFQGGGWYYNLPYGSGANPAMQYYLGNSDVYRTLNSNLGITSPLPGILNAPYAGA